MYALWQNRFWCMSRHTYSAKTGKQDLYITTLHANNISKTCGMDISCFGNMLSIIMPHASRQRCSLSLERLGVETAFSFFVCLGFDAEHLESRFQKPPADNRLVNHEFRPHTARKPFNRFWRNLKHITTSRRPPGTQDHISLRQRGWSVRTPSLPL